MALQELGVIMQHNRANRKNGSVKSMGTSEDTLDSSVAAVGATRSRGRGRSGSRGGRGRRASSSRGRSNVYALQGGVAPGGGACFNCGEMGHLARDCPKPTAEQRCWSCDKPGHVRSECRLARGNRGGRGRGRSRGRGRGRSRGRGGQVRRLEDGANARAEHEETPTTLNADSKN